MGLSDPFQQTYQGTLAAKSSLGEGLMGIAKIFSEHKLQEKKMKQELELKKQLMEQEYKLKAQYPDPFTMMLAKQLGLTGETTQPPTNPIEPYQQSAEKQGFPLSNTMKFLASQPQDQGISPTTGVGTPQEYVQQLFSRIGLAQPPKQQTAKPALDINNLPPGTSINKGGISIKSPTTTTGTTSNEDVKATAQGILNGTIPPDPAMISFRDRTRVNAELERNGFNLNTAFKDWTATQSYIKGMNSQQQIRMGQAISSVKQSVPVLRKLNDEFKRTGWTPANFVELKAALTGTDPMKKSIATKFQTQINVMTDELAQAFMGGGVPTDRAFKLAEGVLNPLYGAEQFSSGLDQLDANLNIRENAIESMKPRVVGGFAGETQNTQSQITAEQAKAELARRRGNK
jgi:hypothetical protein